MTVQKEDAMSTPAPHDPDGRSIVERFRESMVMNHERWHDGTGYDLHLLAEASSAELASIESLLTSRGVHDWRDAEALAALGTPTAHAALTRAFENGDEELKISLISHAPEIFNEEQRTGVLVNALREAGPGLTQAMLLAEEWHPQPVIEALMEGVRAHDGVTAGEFAMMLLFLHGQADSVYDMSQRGFILRFQDEDREMLCRELCARIGTAKP
jgi:hypothetical protein